MSGIGRESAAAWTVLAISLVGNLVLGVLWLTSTSFGSPRWGNIAEWVAGIGSVAAAAVAVGIAAFSYREQGRRDEVQVEAARDAVHRERWHRAAVLGTDLWVAIDRDWGGQPVSDSELAHLQRRINVETKVADAVGDDDLGAYLGFLCSRCFQPLSAVSDDPHGADPRLLKVRSLMADRQDFLDALNVVAESSQRTGSDESVEAVFVDDFALDEESLDRDYPTGLDPADFAR